MFPALGWNPRPLKLQFLLDVLPLTLFKKYGILVVYCQAFLQGSVFLSTFKNHEEARFFTAVVEGWREEGGERRRKK